jgi:hypothetical protein
VRNQFAIAIDVGLKVGLGTSLFPDFAPDWHRNPLRPIYSTARRRGYSLLW